MLQLEQLIPASECTNIDAVREQIDLIDAEIISLFALRNKYVHEIVRYKSDEESIIAINRKNEVIKQRGEWALQNGLNKQTFEDIYRILIDSNIQVEMELLNKKQ
jgi:isochorismate pyruvate lyase